MLQKRSLNRVYIVSACRTPIGKTAGSLSNLNDVALMSLTLREVIGRLNIQQGCSFDDVLVGSCFPNENYNLARKTLLAADISYSVPGATINRTCCSSMEALIQGARQIMIGDGDAVIVGGVENMSKSPHVMKNAIRSLRTRTSVGLPSFDEIGENLMDEVGLCAEISARENNITRKKQDQAAYNSYQRAIEAKKKGFFKEETFPVHSDLTSQDIALDHDENIPEGITMEMLQKEEPIFLRDGTITKLNATSINDGAAAMILMSERMVDKLRIQPLVEYVDSKTVGVHYKDFSIAPAHAIDGLLKKNQLDITEVNLIELNEAYASQLLLCKEKMGLNDEKVNINGGSIAIGHPLGCTGLRITTTLIYSMLRLKASIGVASMCAGGGMGQSLLFRGI
ncbi:thiolase family protein [Alkaliphilus peptidifermentans]|uniref:acetyl-CoA C-acetyltransferase n=1 Tax=Alkaliphilus peptidifermentans DSM 18978 TaxID=1120976 RepID=A0A1G5K7A1_9FIRM|nr:thiolase family protein [Alkaliphilus peptidifermentans]SCY95970.1 acetyl-CoA C-acetyltransferase [Alkaliphilus peptidifermentans DSM 18978]